MVDRVIVFSQDAVQTSSIYEAMVKDQVDGFEKVGPKGTFIKIHDTKGDNFPSLRTALRAAHTSYDFHQRRTNDGDHALWQHSRNGGAEVYSNYGLVNEGEPSAPLFD